MSIEQYWDGPAELARYYREAEKLRVKRKNEELWMQGLYIYEALCDVSPVLQAFSKAGTKPIPYAKEPYPLDKKSREEAEKNREIETMEKGKNYMENFISQFNNRIGGGKDGNS